MANIEHSSKFFTRIQLKYDSWSNWEAAKNNVPLIGEVCLVEVPSGATGTPELAPPSVLMKVGDGKTTFEKLPWLSAVAADVHSWAKMDVNTFKGWLVSEEGPKLATKAELAIATAAIAKNTEEIGKHETRLGNLEAALGVGSTGDGSISDKVAKLEGYVGVPAEGEAAATGLHLAVENAQKQADKGVADAKAADDKAVALNGALTTEKGRIDTLIGTDTGMSARAIAQDAIAKYAAPDASNKAINTLTEVLEWMEGVDEAEGGASSLIADVQAMQAFLGGENESGSYTALTAGATVPVAVNKNSSDISALSGKVSAIEGSLGAEGATTQAIASAKQEAINTVVGAAGDASSANTVYGAKKYAEEKASAAQSAAEDTAKKYTDAEILKVNGTITTINNNLTGDAAGSVNARIAAALQEAKGYADQSEADAISTVVGTSSDAKTANTVYGAKAFATDAVAEGIKNYKAAVDAKIGTIAENKTIAQAIADAQSAAELVANNNKSAVIGTSSDAKTAETIYGAKAFATDAANTAETNANDYTDEQIETLTGTFNGALGKVSNRPFVAVEKNGKIMEDGVENIYYVTFYCGSASEMF